MDFKLNYYSLYWYNLHYLSVNYPDNPNENQKKEIINLFHNMITTGLTCPICRHHFDIFLKKKDLQEVLASKKNLVTFFLDCHNEVNILYNKKKISYNDAFDYYSKDIIIKNKKYKWENILSVELDGNRDLLIISLFNNQKLDSFPEIFTKTFSKEYDRIKLLIKSSESHLDQNSEKTKKDESHLYQNSEKTKKDECPCNKKNIENFKNKLQIINNQVKQYLNHINKYIKKKL